MKQSTKVLLPLGLFMSVVIPIAVKSMFMETDFFEADNSSKMDYFQPYSFKPESNLDLPPGVIVEANPTQNIPVSVPVDSYKTPRETKKMNVTVSDLPNPM